MPACPSNEEKMQGTIVDEIKRLIGDNYMMICIYSVLMALFLYALYYVVCDALKIIRDYMKYSKLEVITSSSDPTKNSDNQRDVSADTEYYPSVYDEDAPKTQGFDTRKPKDYREQKEKDFYTTVDTKYGGYNQDKSKYIAQVYQGQTNDDVIDDTMAYPEYDNYNYRKPQTE
jgi:hypothetical protein